MVAKFDGIEKKNKIFRHVSGHNHTDDVERGFPIKGRT